MKRGRIGSFARYFLLSLTGIAWLALPPARPLRAQGVRWVPVPLRTAEQKAKGYAGGEMGQMAQGLAISKSDPDHLALAVDCSGVYVSADAGRSWRLKRNGFWCVGAQSVAFDPKNSQVLLAAGYKAWLDPVDFHNREVDGIHLSADGGDTWRLVQSAGWFTKQPTKGQNEYFAFDPESFDGRRCRTIYAATHTAGLLKSEDGGERWRPLALRANFINAIALHPLSPRLLFAAADSGLYRSDDAGKTFRRVGAGLPDGAPVLGLAPHPADMNVLTVTAGTGGIWDSGDGGKTFVLNMPGIGEWERTHYTWSALGISPVPPYRLYVDANASGGPFLPYRREDKEKRWQPVVFREPGFNDPPSGVMHWFTEPFAVHPADPDIAYCAQNSVRKTVDGGRTWLYCSDGIIGNGRNNRTSLAFHPDDPGKMAFAHADFGTAVTADGGDTFSYRPAPRQEDLNLQSMAVVAYDPRPGTQRLIGTVGTWTEQRICVSENDGRDWTILPGHAGHYNFLAFHPQSPRVVYAGRENDGLRSDDRGLTWGKTIPHPIKAVFPGNGDIVYAAHCVGMRNGLKWHWEVLMSKDRGETWSALAGPRIVILHDIDVDPKDPLRVYAAAEDGVWIFNRGRWSVRDERHGLEKNRFGHFTFTSVAVDPTRPDVVYAGQRENWNGVARGVFRSTDGGATWKNISANLGPGLNVFALTVSPHDGSVWLGSQIGNWRLAE